MKLRQLFQFRLRTLLLLIVAAAILLAVLAHEIDRAHRRKAVSPLPPLDTIHSMKVCFWDPTSRETVEFDVPQDHWGNIYAGLLPARRDPHPAKWEGMGSIEIKRKFAFDFEIALFYTDAFAIETWGKQVYYRGGDSNELVRAIRAAQSEVNEASENR